jgi:hypothetical protein
MRSKWYQEHVRSYKKEGSKLSFKSFRIIEDFIKEFFGCNLLADRVDERIAGISELMTARWAIKQIIEKNIESFDEEFMNFVFPILEVAVQWRELNKSRTLPSNIVEKFKERIASGASSNFLGVIFEIDMATRCLLSGWESEFVEARIGRSRKIDLLIVKPTGEKIGLECTSKRAVKELSTVGINETIDNKSKKFRPECLDCLDRKLDLKVVVLDITRKGYKIPAVLKDLNKVTVPHNLDGVVLTWREDFVNEKRHSLRIKYESLGDAKREYFTTTWAAEFRPSTPERGAVFFLRKYVEPEPQIAEWGPEETFKD